MSSLWSLHSHTQAPPPLTHWHCEASCLNVLPPQSCWPGSLYTLTINTNTDRRLLNLNRTEVYFVFVWFAPDFMTHLIKHIEKHFVCTLCYTQHEARTARTLVLKWRSGFRMWPHRLITVRHIDRDKQTNNQILEAPKRKEEPKSYTKSKPSRPVYWARNMYSVKQCLIFIQEQINSDILTIIVKS